MRVVGVVLALSSLVLALGCGGAPSERANQKAGPAVPGNQAPAAAGEPAKADPPDGPGQPIDRKIIYNAILDLIVENIGKADQELRQLVAQHPGAYIARSELRGAPGSPRRGSWTLRVPAGQFDGVRQALLKLGEAQLDSLDSQDVTEQFYDLDARIKNNLARAESLRKLLEKATPDYLAVQQKLDQVTAELDVQKGQLQRLDKLSTLATLTLTMQERKGYVPQEAPTFGARIGRTFNGSVELLRQFGEGMLILVVGAAPWLPVIAVAGSGLWWLARPRKPAPRALPTAHADADEKGSAAEKGSG